MEKIDFIVSIAFLRLKNTIATTFSFGCLEETRPYLRKPSPRKMIYLNPLTHNIIVMNMVYLLINYNYEYKPLFMFNNHVI